MSLSAGTRLGPYEITALIGSGGRGPALELAERSPATANSYENAPVTRFPRGSEVYKALDTRLDRTVAKPLTCSVQLLPHGLELHLALNGDTPYFSRTFHTPDELLAWAEEERVQTLAEGWS